MQNNDGSGVAAVERALTILAAFNEGDNGLTLHEVSARTGLYKSTILRLMASLERFGYMRRDQSGSFTIGPAPLRLAQIYQESFRLEDEVRPILRRLVEDSGETATFYVRDVDKRCALFREEPKRSVRAVVREGDRLPLEVGVAGRVILAFSGEEGARYDAIRTAVVLATPGERGLDLAGVAAPVFKAGNTLCGVLQLSGPLARFDEELFSRCKILILDASRRLSQAIGGLPKEHLGQTTK